MQLFVCRRPFVFNILLFCLTQSKLENRLWQFMKGSGLLFCSCLFYISLWLQCFLLAQHCPQLLFKTDSHHAVCSALQLAPAKPGQPGSKARGQLEEKPWPALHGDWQACPHEHGGNTGKHVWPGARQRKGGIQSCTKVKRDDTVSDAFNQTSPRFFSCILQSRLLACIICKQRLYNKKVKKRDDDMYLCEYWI